MSTETIPTDAERDLPTAPCSVVWSHGHAFVLEYAGGAGRWVGFDAFGRPKAMSPAALRRQGWSHHRDD
ncbi:hypothetical protein [Actinokineospora sp. NBRC 105648]|uniref:hypothetical protein n=1 Tax=Actinokineospora sp. NBRC 105648 TaxID=3032206 RepID=UPI0024A3A094|nr:hypothetical protein [Actinokineospora sp. NBRC 105648]GLZ36773.1 hypothetical protein Acsp05_03980 [Actinokineospora sp. NBRC 105648]